jgi:hypothetical protein
MRVPGCVRKRAKLSNQQRKNTYCCEYRAPHQQLRSQ